MCGIAGFITKDGERPFATIGQLRAMFIEASTRGKDSSGVYFWHRGKGITVKYPVKAGELAEILPWGNIIKSPVCLMHTRHATQGDPANNANNHPLAGDDGVVVIHNGVISNSYEYVSHELTDSYALLEAYAEHRKPRDGFALGFRHGLEHLTGSIACAAYSEQDKRLLLVRHDNPICLGFKGDTIFFASTMAIIRHVRPDYVSIMPENYMYSIKADYMKGYKIKTKGGEINGETWRNYKLFKTDSARETVI